MGYITTMNQDKDKMRSIHRRQIARLLDHLKKTGQLTVELEKDIKRSFGYVFQDVEQAIKQGKDTDEKETINELR